MGKLRQAKRDARRATGLNRRAALSADALGLADLFPGVAEEGNTPYGQLVAVAWGSGLTLREEAIGLCLTCTYRTPWFEEAKRGRNLTYPQVLDLIRGGGHQPAELELVLAPVEATGAWSLDQAEWVMFGPGEWRLLGWVHRGQNCIWRGLDRLYRLGMEASPGDPYIDVSFRLALKVQDLGRKQLLAARAAFDRVPGVGRPHSLPWEYHDHR